MLLLCCIDTYIQVKKISYFSVSSPPYPKTPYHTSLVPFPSSTKSLASSVHSSTTYQTCHYGNVWNNVAAANWRFLSANQQCPLKQPRINLTALDVRFTLNSLISLASLLAHHCVASKSVVSSFFSKFWSSQCASTREHFFSFLGENKFCYQLNKIYFWNRKKKKFWTRIIKFNSIFKTK